MDVMITGKMINSDLTVIITVSNFYYHKTVFDYHSYKIYFPLFIVVFKVKLG